MKVLIGCEYSGIVSQAFLSHNHKVTSCDLLPSEQPEGIIHNTTNILNLLDDDFDLLIAFPPCTYLAKCQMHLNSLGRKLRRQQAFSLVLRIYHSKTKHIAIENPTGWLNTNWRPPDQITSPHFYGSHYKKEISLWLKNVPPLMDTYVSCGSKRVANNVNGRMSQTEKSKIKSRFFPEMAEAMAQQWSNL